MFPFFTYEPNCAVYVPTPADVVPRITGVNGISKPCTSTAFGETSISCVVLPTALFPERVKLLTLFGDALD
jgi:hypothetical protein